MMVRYVSNDTFLESSFHVLFVGIKIVMTKNTFVVKSAKKLLSRDEISKNGQIDHSRTFTGLYRQEVSL